jgi:hypothetical protein
VDHAEDAVVQEVELVRNERKKNLHLFLDDHNDHP